MHGSCTTTAGVRSSASSRRRRSAPHPAAPPPLRARALGPDRARPAGIVTRRPGGVSADRRSAEVYLAGHLAPLLLRDTASEITPTSRGRALGIPVAGGWTSQPVELGERWAHLLYTDGLVGATGAQAVIHN